jgi:hypothetical protein
LSTPLVTTFTELLLYIFILLLIYKTTDSKDVEKPDGYPQEVYTGGLIPTAVIR